MQTVLGPVSPDRLGPTLMHEHVLSSMRSHWSEPTSPADRELAHRPLDLDVLWRVRANPNLLLDNCELQDRDLAVRELALFKDAGGSTVVELSSRGLAPDPAGLVDVARRTGLQVVLGTGYYVAASHPSGTDERTDEDLAAEMVRDLCAGIDESGVRAGVIGEIGISEPMAPGERSVLLAAARAHLETGALLIVHPGPGATSILRVADLLERAHVPPDRVVLAHVDERLRGDDSAAIGLLRRGFVLGFDTFGRDVYMPWRGRQHPSDAQRIEALVRLLEAGYVDQLVLSQDLAWKHELTAFGGYGYGHVLRDIAPRLRNAGVDERTLAGLLVDNPRRLLPMIRRE